MTHRIEQAESTLHKALAQVLQRKISDPRIRGLVSITGIGISPDLKNARVSVSVLPEEFEKRTIAGLQSANRHIQAEVKKLVALRVVPHLRFELDGSIKKADAVYDALAEAEPQSPDDVQPPPDPAL